MAALTLFTSLVLCCVCARVRVSDCILVCVLLHKASLSLCLCTCSPVFVLCVLALCTVCHYKRMCVCARLSICLLLCVCVHFLSVSSAVIVLLFAAMSISVIRANTQRHGNTCSIVAYTVVYVQLSGFHSGLLSPTSTTAEVALSL